MNHRSLIAWFGKAPARLLLAAMLLGVAAWFDASLVSFPLAAAEPAHRAGFPANAKLRAALAKVVDVELYESPLKHALPYLGELADVPIRLDIQNEAFLEVDEETPITFKIKKVRFKDALDRLLRKFDLGWTIDGDAIVVTSADEAEYREFEVIYDVSDFFPQPLVQSKVAGPVYGRDTDTLISLLTRYTPVETWGEYSGPSPVDAYETGDQTFLSVCLSRNSHQAIQEAIDSFRRTFPTDDREPPLVVHFTAEQAQHEQFAAKLRKVVDVDFDETPLNEALEELLTKNGISFEFNDRGLALLGLPSALLRTVPVSLKLRGLPIDRLLELMLGPVELDWYEINETVIVSSSGNGCAVLQTIFYNVDGLLRLREAGNVRFATSRLAAAEELSQLIQRTVDIESWEELGGAGTIEATVLAGRVLLIVRQDESEHQKIQSLLQNLKASLPAVPQIVSDESIMSIRVYPLDTTGTRWRPDQIEALVRAAVEPASWNKEASLTIAAGTIIAKQTESAHAEIEQLLLELDVLKRNPTRQHVPRSTNSWWGSS